MHTLIYGGVAICPQSTQRLFFCLAISRKHSGKCVAGKEINNGIVGNWIRPVSSNSGAEISQEDRRFYDGKYPSVLDVINIPMLRPQPHGYQPENHLIDSGYYWSLERKATRADLAALLDPIAPLWGNSPSSYNGRNDRIDVNELNATAGSLRLIEVPDLAIIVSSEYSKRKVRGEFTYAGTPYRLAVTDSSVEERYLALPDAKHAIGAAILCISLGEPYESNNEVHAYKLIAAIL